MNRAKETEMSTTREDFREFVQWAEEISAIEKDGGASVMPWGVSDATDFHESFTAVRKNGTCRSYGWHRGKKWDRVFPSYREALMEPI